MAEMIRGHQHDLAVFRRMAASARSPEVKQLASSGVTTIQQHLTLARQIGSRVGTSTTADWRARRTPDDERHLTAAHRWRQRGPEQPEQRRQASRRGSRVRAGRPAGPHDALQMAQMAGGEAQEDETRRLAERIQKDFINWGQRWRELADRNDLKPANHLGKYHQDKVDKLKKASKQDFDRTYATIVVEAPGVGRAVLREGRTGATVRLGTPAGEGRASGGPRGPEPARRALLGQCERAGGRYRPEVDRSCNKTAARCQGGGRCTPYYDFATARLLRTSLSSAQLPRRRAFP